ncbi:hypothetical protein COCCADRAFT_25332 [Bipolaris zeicola 26-R-13]|uniref:Uncharacterized protein n=1 Tax=Cochliobolus carbonum (strain 26-R-13) TaxID=930089 RepID=W6YGB7_COCC2|nr:uncharacterized protein COCCADRAFT_25332 [Bipolaris zeicola 26-R-13]EUC34549.1 hypothetical protein COCCADRAFT_25332 [Bipolaris zeicola 26-R-13]
MHVRAVGGGFSDSFGVNGSGRGFSAARTKGPASVLGENSNRTASMSRGNEANCGDCRANVHAPRPTTLYAAAAVAAAAARQIANEGLCSTKQDVPVSDRRQWSS